MSYPPMDDLMRAARASKIELIRELVPVLAAKFFLRQEDAQTLAAAYVLARPLLKHAGVHAPASATVSCGSLFAILPMLVPTEVESAFRYARLAGLLDYDGVVADNDELDVVVTFSYGLWFSCEQEFHARAHAVIQEGV